MTTLSAPYSWLAGLSFFPILSIPTESPNPMRKSLPAGNTAPAASGGALLLHPLFDGVRLGSFRLRAHLPASLSTMPSHVGLAFGLDAATGHHFLLEITDDGVAALFFVTGGHRTLVHSGTAPVSWKSLTIQQELGDHTLVVAFDDGAHESMRLVVPELRPGSFAGLQGEEILAVQARGVVVSA
jgi:hypothetical protein